MIFVGERINGMYKDVKKAIRKKDPGVIKELALAQSEAGAKYLDVNVGTAAEDPLDAMRWLVETIKPTVDTPLCLDSQKIEVIKAGLEAADGTHTIINSTSGDEDKLDTYIPLAIQNNAGLICLTMNVDGIPQDVDTRLNIAATIAGKAMEHGLEMDRLFIDPLILPLNVDQKQPGYLLEVMSQIKFLSDPPPHIMVGLSNISQMAKEKATKELINRTFLVMAISHGLDSAICDVLDTALVDSAITAELLLDRFIFSEAYLKAARM